MSSAKTIVIHQHGGPEEMVLEDRPVGDPGPGEIRIRHAVCGLNFIDVYQRSGLYKLELPHALGMEASGTVEAVGDGVTHLKVGDRVAYASMPPGSKMARATVETVVPDSSWNGGPSSMRPTTYSGQ